MGCKWRFSGRIGWTRELALPFLTYEISLLICSPVCLVWIQQLYCVKLTTEYFAWLNSNKSNWRSALGTIVLYVVISLFFLFFLPLCVPPADTAPIL